MVFLYRADIQFYRSLRERFAAELIKQDKPETYVQSFLQDLDSFYGNQILSLLGNNEFPSNQIDPAILAGLYPVEMALVHYYANRHAELSSGRIVPFAALINEKSEFFIYDFLIKHQMNEEIVNIASKKLDETKKQIIYYEQNQEKLEEAASKAMEYDDQGTYERRLQRYKRKIMADLAENKSHLAKILHEPENSTKFAGLLFNRYIIYDREKLVSFEDISSQRTAIYRGISDNYRLIQEHRIRTILPDNANLL